MKVFVRPSKEFSETSKQQDIHMIEHVEPAGM